MIIYNAEYNPEEMYLASKQVIVDELQTSKPNKRGSFSVAKFKMFGELIWDPAQGICVD